jgi:hypothetical protein
VSDVPVTRREFEREIEVTQRALVLEKVEMQRRLSELNNLRDDVTRDRGQFVLRAVHDADLSTMRARHEADLEVLKERISLLENWRSKATGATVIMMLFAGLAGAAIVRALGA